jgi:hypothetical protein
LVKNSTAPACIACTVIGISPWPVIKIIGMARSASASRCCSSSPLRPGSRHRRERRDPEPHRPQEVREGLAQRRIIIDDADYRVSFGHDSLTLSQERPRHDGALWRRACRPPPSAADLSRRPRPARHRPCVPVLLVRSCRMVDVTLPARVWALGRSTQRERRRGRHRAVVGRLASARGAIIRRLALEVMWPHAPSAVSACRHLSPHVVTICRWGPGRRPPQSALPAAQAVMRRTMAGGHRARWSVGTEPAFCRSASVLHSRGRRPSVVFSMWRWTEIAVTLELDLTL